MAAPAGPRLSRRRFLGIAGGAGLALAGGAAAGRAFRHAGAPKPSPQLVSQLPLPDPFQVPLPLPRVLQPIARGPRADRYEIVQREADVEILPGRTTRVWGYGGTFPGPTIESRSGRAAIVRHRNELPVPVAVHLHGGRTPAHSDGYPTDLVRARGGARIYRYPLKQRATMLWYHDHRMDFTGPAVYRGLAGLHIVRDAEEDALPLPRGERELPLVIADRAFGRDGELLYPSLHGEHGVQEPYIDGVQGDVILVNGAPWPVHEVSATRHRLRFLVASNARSYELALDPPPPDGPAFVQIGSDGGLLAAPRAHDSVQMGPAERYDLVVDFGRYPVGTEVTLVNRLGGGSTGHVMRFRIVRREREDSHIPARLSEIEPLERHQAAAVRDLSFHAGQVGHHHRSGWLVNGEPFSPDTIHARPRLGDVEIWRLKSDWHHPIHLHLVHFQVLSRGGGAPGSYDGGLKDTVYVAPDQIVEVIARFDGYPGRYVFHCHNLEHEDMGMMANFQLAPR